ncbi:MAG TPA: barstar family protein [Solirubrobacterales bacterium]|nr:barstar family protein [Solirubrobacterales bacterium]
MTEPQDLTRPAPATWQSVHFAEEPPDAEALGAAGVRVAEVDASRIEDKQGLMAALSDVLELPDWFGGNWDALDESLRDLGWLEASGHVVVMTRGEELWKRDPELAGMLVRSWIDAGGAWADKGVPFHLVFVR